MVKSTEQMVIRYFDRNETGELVEIIDSVDLESITCFGIYHRKAYRSDGTFKKWLKYGFIRYSEGTESKAVFSCDPLYIKLLKEELKGKYKAEKHSVSEYKKTRNSSGHRTAIDWTYSIKEN